MKYIVLIFFMCLPLLGLSQVKKRLSWHDNKVLMIRKSVSLLLISDAVKTIGRDSNQLASAVAFVGVGVVIKLK